MGHQRLFRGVYAPVVAVSGDVYDDRRQLWLARAKAAIELYADRRPVLYGVSALQAMGVALPREVEDWAVVHLLVGSPDNRPERAGVVFHVGLDGRRVKKRFDGLPVLNPVDHWLQLDRLSVDQMVEIGDGFVRRQSPLLTIEHMRRRLDELEGRQGVKLARLAMRLVRAGTDSIYETKTRLVLVHGKLPVPEVNLPVWCPSVGMTYHVDLGYEFAKVAVEYDGLVHVGDRRQMEIDAERRRNLQDAGWLVITVTAKQLRDPAEIVRSVKSALWVCTTAARRRVS